MTRPTEENTGPAGVLLDQVPAALAAITARLVGSPDDSAVLHLVTEVGTDLLGAHATGVVLTDAYGGLAVVAASDDTAQFVELLQTDLRQGPCVDCIAKAEVVTASDLDRERERWPAFVAAAVDVGYRAVVAVPLRLDGRAVGGFNLLFAETTEQEPWQLSLAQAVADLAVLALVQERGERRADRLFEATITAVNDRVRHGQAVGVAAGTLGIDPDTARALVSAYATRHDRPLREVARALVNYTLDPAELSG